MKKLFLFALCAIVHVTVYSATLQRTILSHKGNLTQYDANHWQEAIENAVAGDTVYFTSGNFGGELIITKPITLIGAGMSENDVYWKDTDLATAYSGCTTTTASTLLDYVKIEIPGSPTLKSTLLEGFGIKGVNITQPVKNLSIKRCHILYNNDRWGWMGEINASEQVTNLQLEDCIVAHFNITNYVTPDIHNCFFGSIDNTPEETEFTNCTIGEIWHTSNCSFVNCIVHFVLATNNTCVNCIYDGAGEQTTFIDSWQYGGAASFTKSQLETGGYIGNDDTVVGPFGGQAPFTLIPSQPYVSSSSLTYDKTTKKLNVNVTVKKGQ